MANKVIRLRPGRDWNQERCDAVHWTGERWVRCSENGTIPVPNSSKSVCAACFEAIAEYKRSVRPRRIKDADEHCPGFVPDWKDRQCLRCEATFRSWGKGNRLCQRCQVSIEAAGIVEPEAWRDPAGSRQKRLSEMDMLPTTEGGPTAKLLPDRLDRMGVRR